MKIPNSKRLSFSMMDRNDAEILFQIDQDPLVLKYINGGKLATRDDIANISIPRMESYANEKKGWGLWKVTSLHDGEVIGFILVRPMFFFSDSPEFDNLELGWRFIRKSWGSGFATEAAENIKKAFEKDKNIKKFTAIAMEENLASINIMKKLGMNYLKTDLHKDPLGDAEVVYYEMSVN